MENNILFDDWEVRCEGVLNRRKKEYILCLVCIGILLLVSIIGMLFDWSCVVFLVFSVITYMSIWLEWLKIKNNHLIIKSNQIEITNRFNKTKIYELNISELVIELRHSFGKNGGIIMLFYNKKHYMISKYEDMLNWAAPYGFEKTNWEKGLEKLGVKIIDTTEIIKN